MLPKSQRLNLKKDFKWVAGGRRLESKYLKLFIRLGENEFPKVGVAVSSKVFKKATERNKAKRLVSAVFEALYGRLPNAVNIVALPKAGISKVKSGDVLLEVEEILKSEKIIN
ncbi:ribonuclease P protein component [Candidatus Daviesbacteria bacterium]|nr:ribonuclease P protein component [Candidatus Daviesbacteria bacterium]